MVISKKVFFKEMWVGFFCYISYKCLFEVEVGYSDNEFMYICVF